MSVLLDTHALVWALTAPERLSPKARKTIEDPSVELIVSAASVWELFLKFHIGKLAGATALIADFDAHLRALGASELAINHTHAKTAATLRHPHKDPFDRMLAAQSIVESLPVITSDPMVSAMGAKTVW